MSEILIKGGTVVDGTAAPGYKADVRVRDGAIVEIAAHLEPGRDGRVFDAVGCNVTPGFIESHTHYDAVMWWQPNLDPLPGNGVTTVILGNCGFSAAPVSSDLQVRMEMVKIFSFFEDIPLDPFAKELPWDWQSWPEYKRSLTGRVKVSANYAAFVGHIALRLAVLGMEAWERAATAAEIQRIAALLEEALCAGALGLSSNLMDHDGDDRAVPSLKADDAEFGALIEVLERHPGSSLQIIPDTFMRMTAPQQMDRIARLCKNRKVRVQWAGGIPTLDFQKQVKGPMLEQFERYRRGGQDFWAGYAHVSPSSTIGVYRSLIFAQSNDYVWHEVVLATSDEAKLQLLRDPEWRARARKSWDHEAWKHSPFANAQHLLLLDSENGTGPVKMTLGEYARQRGIHCSDAMAEWMIRNGLHSTVHMAPFPMDEETVIRLLKDPMSVGNISDAGAHGQMLCGGGENVLLFTKYVRQLQALSLEEAVHVQTGKLAKHFCLHDRGEIKVGKRADIAVFKLDEIQYRDMIKVNDVPDGKGGKLWRWTREAAPVRLTLVNGVPTFEGGKFTGALPGQMIGPSAP